ncbi:MAG: hypothetical protein CVU01_00585 [Bacteroidetes bacterium HGW-Bacteroidetes-18]|nr:MAG: hypothetical protein CVU01_00585 [Bacteroidetes bacterium HGW-Bacteroidetes-18]
MLYSVLQTKNNFKIEDFYLNIMHSYMDKTKEELINELNELNELMQKLSFIESANTSNKKLLVSEEHYRYLFESNPQPMWIYDSESLSFIEINDAAIHHYGYSREEFLGMTIKDIRPKEDFEALENSIKKTKLYSESGEWRHLKKNGEIIFVEIISHAITINNRKARHVMVNDITSQKKAIDDRTEALMLYNALVNQAGDAFFVHDFEGKFIEVNQQACETLGYSKEELLKLSVSDIEMDFDLKSVKKEWAKIESGNKFTLYGNQKRKDGTIFPVELRFGCSEWKGQKLFLGLARDITERNKAEESLRQSEENLSITLNSIGDGVIATDLNGLVVKMNPIAEKLCGWSLNDAAGMPLTEVFNIVNANTREIVINPVKKVLENGEIVGLANSTILISKNGTEYQISDSAAPIKNKEGKISGVVLVFSDVTEKYLTAQSLMENEERLNLFFNQSLTGFFFMMNNDPVVWDEYVDKEKTLDDVFGHQRVTKVNQAMLNQYLATEDEFINRTLYEFFAHDLKQGRRVIKDLFDRGSLHIETSELRFDGTQMWIEGDYICLYDSKGRIKGLFGTQHDITNRKNTLNELQISKMELEEYFENDISADYILSVDGYVLSCNNTFLKLFGLKKKPDPGILNIIDFYKYPEQRKILVNRLGKERKIENYAADFVTSNGQEINAILNAIGIFDENDKLIKVRGYIVDITKQIKAEAATRLNDTALKVISQGVIITDTNRCVISSNASFTAITGYSESEIIGRTCKFLQGTNTNPLTVKAINEALNLNSEFEGDILNYRKDRTPFWNELTISPIFNNNGLLTHFIGVTRDITERKKILEDLIIAKEQAVQSDKLKSAFLANMSHEIRTPMNGILGFTELLKEPDLSNVKQQKFINIIQKSGARLLNIINDIVDISKIEAGVMEADIKASNIKEQIEYIYTFFKPEVEKKGLQFLVKNNFLEEDLMIETDCEKIYAIFTNLIKNAIKFTNKGLIIFGYERKGEYLEFYVKDTGIGISKDKHEAIFERFIQADISNDLAIQGAGLGLSITKAYVELLGGKIWVESEVENLAIGKLGGSTFYFNIPFNPIPVIKTNPQNVKLSGKSGEQAGDLKILIAEDDEASSLYLSILVEEFSSEILMAKNGIEAVEIYKNNPEIDLILMDMQMPYLNGFEATSQIRQLNKNVVIIAQTAFALSFDRQKVIDAGCNDYISKPISTVELTAVIRKYFN